MEPRLTSRAWLPALAIVLAAAPSAPPPGPRDIPPLVFVSRQPVPGSPGVVPGLGIQGRTAAAGGRLMVREPNGRVRPLLAAGLVYDVADPSVAWDGRSIAFAAKVAPDSAWRIHVVRADGGGFAAVTRSDRALDLSLLGREAARFTRYDDFDPCWMPDGRLCFASTRFPQLAEQGDVPASNLYVVDPAQPGPPLRLTAERNGAEEPAIDPASGRIVYARWWFNRYLPADLEGGLALERARSVEADTIDLWQALSIRPDGEDLDLAGGNPRVRLETMAYQPALGANTLVGVRADQPSLLGDPGTLVLQLFPGRFAEPVRIGGAPGARSACAPTVLHDGRIVFALDREGRGDYGLAVAARDGSRPRIVVDLPGTLELDPALLAARPRPPVLAAGSMPPPLAAPHLDPAGVRRSTTTFRFDCYNLFANAPVDAPFPDAPTIQHGLKLRFFAVLARPGAPGADTVVLLREAPMLDRGEIHADDIPADTPVFEQLVDSKGRIVRSPGGTAHVPGFNAGRPGSGASCVGCHTGHSVLPIAASASLSARTNLAPSADVTASSVAERTSGVRGAVDRRARGDASRVAWVANGAEDEWIRLTWPIPVEVDSLILYALGRDPGLRTDLRIQRCEIGLFHESRQVHRIVLRQPPSPKGTPVDCRGMRITALEVRPMGITGTVRGVRAAALAEIEVRARMAREGEN